MKFNRFVFLLILLVSVNSSTAQKSFKITYAIDKGKILIGEPLQLTLEAVVPADFKTDFYAIDSIEHFEFLKPVQVDSSVGDNKKTIKAIYTLTSFDSGHWVIPSFVLNSKVKSDTIPVDVVFAAFNPEQDYHDIKDIIEVKEKTKKDWLWYAVAGTVLILLLIYFLLKKRKNPVPVAAPAINAYEDALKQLAELKKQNLAGKDFHTRLVEIFKLYVLRKKNILSLQKTTEDLGMQLRVIIKDPEMYNQLQQTLRLSDFVKFAKYNSNAEEDQHSLLIIKNTISQIEESS
jgi:LPXTG-motif cell wall-anchored protein